CFDAGCAYKIFFLALHLPRHYGVTDTFPFEGIDQLRELAQRHPMHRRCAPLLNFRKSFFFDGRDNYIEALRARSVEHEEWELAVSGNQAEFAVGRQETSNQFSQFSAT